MSHTARISFFTLAPANLKAMINLSTVKQSSLGERLVELVQLRVSQVNGCGICVDMHWRDLIKQEADPRHLNAIAGWREAPFFSSRERAGERMQLTAEQVEHLKDQERRQMAFSARTALGQPFASIHSNTSRTASTSLSNCLEIEALSKRDSESFCFCSALNVDGANESNQFWPEGSC